MEFIWYFNFCLNTVLEDVISPDVFARKLCKDVGILSPPNPLINQIIKSIKEQIDDFYQHAPESLDTKEGRTAGNDGIDTGDRDLPELRTVIKLDITIDQQCVVDQFEWDIGCTRNSPELFAETLVADLGLVPEFKYLMILILF